MFKINPTEGVALSRSPAGGVQGGSPWKPPSLLESIYIHNVANACGVSDPKELDASK